jgi:hypothetical protein
VIDLPEFEPALRATMHLRYDDVAQDGSLKVDAMPHFVGASWAGLYAKTELADACNRDGIVPILTRLVAVRTARPISVVAPIEARSAMTIARAGERRLLVFDLELHAREGHTFGADGGEKRRVGRVRAEHVFTRPFAPPERRKVAALPLEPSEVVTLEWKSAAELAELPAGAPRASGEIRKTFELRHTDPNQHVNSLVYPRAFEAAAHGAIAEPGALLARAFDIHFRKPCFAGEVADIATRVFGDVAYGTLSVGGAPRIHCRMQLEAPPKTPFG